MAINSIKNGNNIVDLYIAAIPDGEIEAVYPPDRQAQIDTTPNTDLKRQRYYVWKLLEHALKHSFNLKPENIEFSITGTGKWDCEACFFSLSHTKNAVAVAISNKPVGVDIEAAERNISKALCHKILTDTELTEYNATEPKEKKLYLLKKWCAKESLFKMNNVKHFKPRQIEANRNVCTGTATINGYDLFYSVASTHTEILRIFENTPLYNKKAE